MIKINGIKITKLGKDKEKIVRAICVLSFYGIQEKTHKRIFKQIESLPVLIFFNENELLFAKNELEKLGCSIEIVSGPFNMLNKEYMDSTNFDDYSLNEYFKENLSFWYSSSNNSDCMTYLGHKEENNVHYPIYRKNFRISLDEEILFTRDTSSWNSRDEGLVITDKAIYVIYTSGRVNKTLWSDVIHVDYKEYNFYFYGVKDKELIKIGKSSFFKYIDDERLESFVGPSLAFHFTMMAQLATINGIYYEVEKLEEEKQYDKAIAKLKELMKQNRVQNDAFSHYHMGRILTKKAINSGHSCFEHEFNSIDEEFKIAEDLSSKSFEQWKNELVTGQIIINKPEGQSSEGLDSHAYNYWRGLYHNKADKKYEARKLFLDAMNSENEEIKKDANEKFFELEKQMIDIWDNYTSEYDYKDRKFLMPINDDKIEGCYVKGIETFCMSNIPSCIKFPTGHPIANELYIAHPFNSSLYVPYEESEDFFFVDKIHELCYLFQCLGAEKISITSIKGRSINEINNIDAIAGGNADIKAFPLTGEISFSSLFNRDTKRNVHRTITKKLDPIKFPYVPEDLIWYPNQTEWQRMVESRLSGNLLEYNEFVSTSDTNFVSNNERASIKASAEYLWTKIEGNAEIKLSSQFKETNETQWKVEVEFRSLNKFEYREKLKEDIQIISNLKNKALDDLQKGDISKIETLVQSISDRYKSKEKGKFFSTLSELIDKNKKEVKAAKEENQEKNAIQISQNEQEYLDNLKDFLEDDAEITPRERKMLDRIRQSLGISEERAKELEASLAKPQLTEDEQEYLDIYREYAEKGEITEKERRKLDISAKGLGISSDRAKEIESME